MKPLPTKPEKSQRAWAMSRKHFALNGTLADRVISVSNRNPPAIRCANEVAARAGPGWGDDDVALARDVLDRQLVDTSVRARYRTLAILAAGVLVLVTGIRVASVSDNPAVIGGPMALLLASSTDY